MADSEELKRLQEVLVRSIREQEDVYLSLGKTSLKLQNSFDELVKAEKENTDILNKNSEAAKKELAARTQFDQALRRNARQYIEDERRIRQAKKNQEITGEEAQRLLNENTKNYADSLEGVNRDSVSYLNAQVFFARNLGKVNDFLNNEFTRTLNGFVKGIFTAGVQSASGLETRIQIASTTFETAFKLAASAAGAIPIIGDSAKELVTKIGEGGKALLDFFGKEAVKLAGALKQTSSAGFVFADGLTGLRTAATNAGLTADIFSKALLENREAVMQFGGSMTEGARRVGRVVKEIDVDRLQQLGVGLDEIPGLIAEVGARMRRSGSVTDVEVARQTEKYAQNLRLIAELTGQDAKTLQAKRDANERDLAFQQFLAAKSPAEAEEIRRQLELLPAASQDLFKEMAQTGGQIFSESGNILAQQAPAIAEMARRLFSAAETGGVTKDTSIEILKDIGTTAKEEIKNLQSFARAAAVLPEYQEVGQKLAESFKTLNAIDFNKIDEVRKQLEQAGRDDPSSKLLREEERKGMQQQVDLQNLVNGQMKEYLRIVSALNTPVELLTEGMRTLSRFIREHFGGPEAEAANAAYLRNNISQQEQNTEISRLRGRMTVQQQSPILSSENIDVQELGRSLGVGTSPPDVVDYIRENPSDQRVIDFLTSHPGIHLERFGSGQALGGILSGPTTGYLAKLHGTEAVLPENLTDMLMDAAKSAQTVKEQLPAAINARNASEDLLSDISAKFDNMIEILNSISGHTEMTAARVA
ncbi:hypothetical protein EB001_06225 [bacterium]|nr:hypothetical protein [bacterium]